MSEFDHRALKLTEDKGLVYTAFSKHLFYYCMYISKFVLEQGMVPMNPFMLFDYFLLDAVDRDVVRAANNTSVLRADEMWVFGPIADGVLAEIRIAKEKDKPIRCFEVVGAQEIVEIPLCKAQLEDEVKEYQAELL